MKIFLLFYMCLFAMGLTHCYKTTVFFYIYIYIQWPTNRKSYMIYRTGPLSMTLNGPYPRFQGHAILWCWISQKDTRYRHHLNGIGTYTCATQQCHFEWPWVTLKKLAKCSMTRSVARSFCDSWASCTTFWLLLSFYRATRMHSADYAVARCLSVRLPVRPSVTRRYWV